jgi:hypothetical protein
MGSYLHLINEIGNGNLFEASSSMLTNSFLIESAVEKKVNNPTYFSKLRLEIGH